MSRFIGKRGMGDMLHLAGMMTCRDLSAMAEGIYFLQISDGEDTVVRRIMITR